MFRITTRWSQVFLTLAFLFNTQLFAQSFSSELKKLSATINEHHFAPKTIDDQFSSTLYELFFLEIDPQQKFLTEQDVSSLSEHEQQLDDQINSRSVSFLKDAENVYKTAVERYQKMVEECYQNPIDLSKPVSYTLRSALNTPVRVADPAKLKERKIKSIKYNVLTTHYAAVDWDSTAIEDIKAPSAEEIKTIADRLKKRDMKAIKNALHEDEGLSGWLENCFLQAFAKCFDPHTFYMTMDEKEEFVAQLSTEELSFGLEVSENDQGQFEIAGLIPGGPAWRSNQLNEGDKILQLRTDKNKVQNASLMDASDVYDCIYSSKVEKLTIKVRKKNGEIIEVVLYKEKIQSGENRINGFVLGDQNKFGYISLPGFYTSWDDQNMLGCANDIAKEILKLKKDNIQGLILDLRNNGGGSMKECIDLGGLFINYGPLGIEKARNQKPMSFKDMNRGIAYNGPLIILINRFSASASEVFAAAMQDHNRAVIVGSHSLGKATAQLIYPTDMAASNPTSFVKVTEKKLYRITCGTHQLSGVQPDISLPDFMDGIEYGESTRKQALAADSVVKKMYYTPLPELPLKELKEKSASRIATNEQFEQLKKVSNYLSSFINSSASVELTPKGYLKFDHDQHDMFKVLYDSKENTEENTLPVKNVAYDSRLLELDEFQRESVSRTIEDIQVDPVISEAFFILNDLINLK